MGNLIGLSALRKTLSSGKYNLNIAVTTNGAVGTKTLCLGTRNVALADHGNFTYLCVFRHSAAVAATPTDVICGNRYALATSGECFCPVGQSQGDAAAANAIVIGNRALSTNANGDLICKDVTAAVGTPDEEGFVFLGVKPLRAVRKGGNWYLVVKV